MSMTPNQIEAATVLRRVYFGTADGKRALGHLLQSDGLFQDPEETLQLGIERPDVLRDVIKGLMLLKSIGVWHPENYGRLIDAMAALPMPDIQETE